MLIGTNYFVSLWAAVQYYAAQGESLESAFESVVAKFNAGEIKTGFPNIKPGESVVTVDEGRRYAIAQELPKAQADYLDGLVDQFEQAESP